MPITTQDKEKLQAGLDAFDTTDSVAMARLLYETLLDAKNQGLGVNAIWSLGKLIYDKSPWEIIAQVEDAIGKQPIRMPLIRSTDTVFKALLPSKLPKLPEENKSNLKTILEKLDAAELISLTSLLYATLCQCDFAVADKDFAGMHPFTKFLISGWTWEELKSVEPLLKGICIPLVNTCHGFLRETLPEIIRVEDPTQEVTSQTGEQSQPPTDQSTPSPEEIITASEANAAKTETEESPPEEGGVSDPEPFIQEATSETASETQQVQDPREKSTQTSQETTSEKIPDDTQGNNLKTKPEESETPSGQKPPNGHRLSKKQRRELRRQQREAQGQTQNQDSSSPLEPTTQTDKTDQPDLQPQERNEQ